MKKFSFQFEKLLRVRAFTEKEAKEALGREIGALNAIETQLAENSLAREQAAQNRFAANNSLSDIDVHDYYIKRLDTERGRLLKEAELQNKKVDEARETYIEASRENKIIEKLKEKQFAAYKKESQAAEDAEIDELANR
jgi:flagellar FliJ protein